MIFASPWVLAALAALPVLWWLLRVTPPAPRSETFPAIRLLVGLRASEETPARTPWWLLALRLTAAALVIAALAGPVLDPVPALPGSGPVLLVVDNGWAAAADWPERMQAANAALDRAAREGRPGALLATAPDEAGEQPKVTATMPVPELRARLAALHPEPWPPDRSAAAAAVRNWPHGDAAVVYVADGLTHGSGLAEFAPALRASGQVTEICCGPTPARLLLPPESEADRLVVRVAQVPQPVATGAVVLAQSDDGRTLARADIALSAGETAGSAAVRLPPELRNRLARLVIDGPPSAGSVMLLDEQWRRRPVGLVAGGLDAADTPFDAPLYYLRRALQPFTELREGDLDTLLGRDLSVLILADSPLPEGPGRNSLTKWVEHGGLLIRFAGPRTAGQPAAGTDPLMPVKLLGGDRQLGGALSWSEPAGLAPFPPASPFAGEPVPAEVRVTRQVLAEPGADLSTHTWAALADGTPLVTGASLGTGHVVLFHVTATADWSDLPLSGLFVDMLRRLVALSAGVAAATDNTVLAPAGTLDGFGQIGTPPPAAAGLRSDAIAATLASPHHPPGLYGPENGRRALNLGASLPLPAVAPAIPGARVEPLSAAAPEHALGHWLLAVAILLLIADMLAALGLRGLLRAGTTSVVLALALALPGAPAHALDSSPNPALATRLGYVVTGDPQVDGVSRAGLEGLSDYINRRTSAVLAEPDAVEPGDTDLSFYPLLYWPVAPGAAPLAASQAAALNGYMARGGIILIDTRDSGPAAGFGAAGGGLPQSAPGLEVPPLAPLTTDHVLARSFYLLHDFPGRYAGGTVWVQSAADRTNDGVSPVIVGGNDWASAWAVDAEGRSPFAVIPGGQQQRLFAFRFGVNLVMYALTGNYKGDQVHLPAILQRLGR